MNKQTERDHLIHEAATKDVDGEAWRERMERWLDLTVDQVFQPPYTERDYSTWVKSL